MSKFIMLVGLPGSGKSTFAKELSIIENAVVLSSDQIREEMFSDVSNQESPDLIFGEMNRRANNLLSKKKNVIYDATNLNRKRRKHLIRFVIRSDKKCVYYMNEHIDTIKKRNGNRTRKVDDYVIKRMYKNLQIPILNEGWNEVNYISTMKNLNVSKQKSYLENLLLGDHEHDEFFEKMINVIPDFQVILNLPQDSIYHSFSVSRHTYFVYENIKKEYDEADKLILLWASIFHDLGKAFCKSFTNYKGEKTRYANFIGHEHVSAQLAAWWLTSIGYDDEFVHKVTTLVQCHMIPMNASDKKLVEIERLIGDELYKKLMILHTADMEAK